MNPSPARMSQPLHGAVSGRPGRVVRFKGGAGAGGRSSSVPTETLVMIGVWVALVPTLMLFLGLVSAYIVRQGLGTDWTPVNMPPLLWGNTLILLGSSATLEGARRLRHSGKPASLWMWASFALGTLFLAGQVVLWRQLMAAGIDLGTTPYGSFFYVLSGTHAVHLAGGVLGLLAATVWPARGWFQVEPGTAARAATLYWHFLDGVWVALVLLLVLWR